jgi:uncharacterized membrane protein YgcG
MTDPLDDLRTYARELRAAVPPEESRTAVAAAMASVPAPIPWHRRITVAAAAAGFFSIGNVAMAGVANEAVPGDVLYPVDRAYEAVLGAVGLTGEPTEERLDEVAELVTRGQPDEAMAHLVASVDMPVVGAAVSDIAAEGLPEGELGRTVIDLLEATRSLAQTAGSGDEEGRRRGVAAVHQVVDAARHAADPARDDQDGPNQNQGNQGQDGQGPDDPGPDDQGQGNQGEGNQGQSNQGEGGPSQGTTGDGDPGLGSGGQGNAGQPDEAGNGRAGDGAAGDHSSGGQGSGNGGGGDSGGSARP